MSPLRSYESVLALNFQVTFMLCEWLCYFSSLCSGRLSGFFCLFPPCPHFLCVLSCSCQRDRLLTELILKRAMIWHKSSLRLQLKKLPSCTTTPTPAGELDSLCHFNVTAAVGQVSEMQHVGLSITSSQAEDLFNMRREIYKDFIYRVI